MDAVRELSNINLGYVFVSVVVIIVAYKFICDLIDWMKKRWRIKTGKEEDKESIEKRISTLEKHDKSQYEKMNEIITAIDEINGNLVDFEIQNYRFEILDMASAIYAGRKYSKEQYDHILSIHDEYEGLLEKIGKTNGQVDASMEVIKAAYKDRMLNGF